jgi:hypothetical protein
MVVFSNRRLGPSAELIVSDDVALGMLRATADAARVTAASRWEHELIAWLGHHVPGTIDTIDVDDVAWTPDHFEVQRAFLTDAIARAAIGFAHERALRVWARMVEAHSGNAVRVGRRWQLHAPI